ncbi:MAG: hypothetical protein HY593_06660 [Candidatus Omnitrophica bacterium]|nr:hypothetical protein [Candidatus Omnitrophota bacterium]
MKIKDLIEKLKTFPTDTKVLVRGYEDGYDDVVLVEEKTVVKDQDAPDWNGEYDNAEPDAKNTENAVVIFGNRR